MKLNVLCLLAASTTGLFGSTIFGNLTTTETGSTYTVVVNTDNTTGADMAGIFLTATFSTGGDASCTWLAAGTCTSASNFSVSYPAGNSTHPQSNNSNWTITNNRAGANLTSLTVNGIPAMIGFDRCMTGASTFNDSNPSGFFGGNTGTNCDTTGTANSNIGFSVGSGNGGGTTSAEGTVVYRNALHLAAAAPVGDLWGEFTITFITANFTTGQTFTFRTDSDGLSSAVADVVATPEPSTLALCGIALIGLGLRLRSKRPS